MLNYKFYKEQSVETIKECIKDMGCQPILFIGSGFSKRYFDAPNWHGLLEKMATANPLCHKYNYYKQNYGSCIKIGTELAKEYFDWAWNEELSIGCFDEKFKSDNYSSDIFLKSKICDFFKEITPKNIDDLSEEKREELELIKQIRPHAVITTNYDNFLEVIFDDFTPIIGQKILKNQYNSIGEIFKIHGCVTEPESLIITEKDYDEFKMKKKYLSAKMLTYFLEHPLIFIGYGVNDPNIQTILSDIDEILVSNSQLVPNIFLLNWEESINEEKFYNLEELLNLEDSKKIRIKSIVTDKYNWVFEALINEDAVSNINPKLLRALLARTYELVRTDIPRKKVEINYELLESALSDDSNLNKIYGITTLTDPSALNAGFPYTISQVAEATGCCGWGEVQNCIEKIAKEKQIKIKDNDNKYHIAVKTGKKSITHKYSNEFVKIVEKIIKEEKYDLD